MPSQHRLGVEPNTHVPHPLTSLRISPNAKSENVGVMTSSWVPKVNQGRIRSMTRSVPAFFTIFMPLIGSCACVRSQERRIVTSSTSPTGSPSRKASLLAGLRQITPARRPSHVQQVVTEAVSTGRRELAICHAVADVAICLPWVLDLPSGCHQRQSIAAPLLFRRLPDGLTRRHALLLARIVSIREAMLPCKRCLAEAVEEQPPW